MGCCIGDCCIGNCGFCCIMDIFGDSCCVAHTSVRNDSAAHAKIINDSFNNMKKSFENKAAVQEQMIIDQINKSMDKFIDELSELNLQKFSGRALNININAIKEKREKLSYDVVGFIGERLHDRIVTTDPEIAPMLKEADDKKRNANIKKFCEKVLQEAKNDLKIQIQKTVKAQQEVVHQELENRLKEINKSLEASTKAYNELLAAVDKDSLEQERLKLQYMYEYDIYSILADKMGVMDDEIKVGVRSNEKKNRVREIIERDSYV